MTPDEPIVLRPSFFRSQLKITEGCYLVYDGPLPNRWRRFWHRFLLGWRWERIEP